MKPPKEMVRVAFDMPANTPIGPFMKLIEQLGAENLETKHIGRQRLPGEAPTRATGATLRDVILYHATKNKTINRKELIEILAMSGFSKLSVNAGVDPLIADKILKSVGRGEYALRQQLALPAPSKTK